MTEPIKVTGSDGKSEILEPGVIEEFKTPVLEEKIPTYQNAGVVRTSDYSEFKRLKQAEKDSLAAYNEGLQHFNANIGGGKRINVWDGTEGFFDGGTETKMNKMEDLIVKDSEGHLDAEGLDFKRVGTDEIKSNPQQYQYKNTGIQPMAVLKREEYEGPGLYQYFKKPKTTVVFDNPYEPGDLSEMDFPTPDQINNMSYSPTATPTKTPNNIKEVSGNVVNTQNEEAHKKEADAYECLKTKETSKLPKPTRS